MPRLPFRNARTSLAVVVAAGLLAGACGGGGEPGVTIANVATDIAFGAPTEEPGPANFNPGPVSADQTGDLELPDQFFPAPARRLPEISIAPAENPCPEAALNEFPDVASGENVPVDPLVLPREGSYRWKRSGTLQSAELAGTTVDVDGFERRLIRNVEVVAQDEDVRVSDEYVQRKGATFTYETVQPDVSTGNVVVTTYRVKTNGGSTFVDPRGATEVEVYAPRPDAGLVLQRIDIVDRQGNEVSSWAPQGVGLLLLPLPVVAGGEFRATATDATSRQQLTLEAHIVGRDRVDACGDIVEGWKVESTITSVSPTGSWSRDYTYMVAPQYGAVIIYEKIDQAGSGDELHLEFSLGQQDPSPLPGNDAERLP